VVNDICARFSEREEAAYNGPVGISVRERGAQLTDPPWNIRNVYHGVSMEADFEIGTQPYPDSVAIIKVRRWYEGMLRTQKPALALD
jgi:hypothetical protein